MSLVDAHQPPPAKAVEDEDMLLRLQHEELRIAQCDASLRAVELVHRCLAAEHLLQQVSLGVPWRRKLGVRKKTKALGSQ